MGDSTKSEEARCTDGIDGTDSAQAKRLEPHSESENTKPNEVQNPESKAESSGADNPLQRLLKAAEKNDVAELNRMLSENPSLVQAADSDGYTALHRACYANHPNAARALLAAGASVRARTADGWEPLHCACKWGALECAMALLQHDADPNSPSEGGLTPVHLAASQPSSRALLETLLWNPFADVRARSRAGDTPKDLAARHGPWASLFDIVADEINVF
ncbi:unnamed protein product [Ixodes pacificus]